jgi:CBS-domain-containing membrane protein
MTPSPQAIGHDALLQNARELMDSGHFRHLPVVDPGGRLTGILSDRDLREHSGHLGETRVNAAVVETPLTIGPDEPIEAAADIMLGRKIGSLPVVDADGRLVGIITETDMLRGLRGRRPPPPDSRSSLDVQLIAPAQTLSEAVRVLESEGCDVLGARPGDDPSTGRMFRLHVDTDDPARAAETLRARGFGVRAVHST